MGKILKSWRLKVGPINLSINETDAAYKILKYFLFPIVATAEISGDADEFTMFEYIMGADNRRIVQYKVIKELRAFKGLWKQRASVYCDIGGRRIIRKGWKVLVVFDEMNRNFVDVEFFKSWDDTEKTVEHCFRFSPEEFMFVFKHLEIDNDFVARYRNKARRPHKGREQKSN